MTNVALRGKPDARLVAFLVLFASGAIGVAVRGESARTAHDLSCVAIVREAGTAVEAARDLEYHLSLIAGTRIDPKAEFRFVFGKPGDAPAAKPFEARYRIDGSTIWFWGDDTARRHGSHSAVSLFLERELGVHWLWAGEDGVDFVPRTRVELPRRAEGSYEPPFSLGHIRNDPFRPGYKRPAHLTTFTPQEMVEAIPEIMREAYEKRTVWLRRHRHQDREFLRYGHAFRDWKARFSATHPEYLNLHVDPKTGAETRGWTALPNNDDRTKHCVSNEAVVDQVIADWCAAGTNRYLNICENDSENWCECGRCCALDVPMPGERRFHHVTDRYVNFWNRIAKKACAIRPDVVIVTYAYSQYRDPPRRERVAYPDNMLFGMVPSLMDDFAAQIDGWRRAGLRRFFLRPNYQCSYAVIPRGLEKVCYDIFHKALAQGMEGVDYTIYKPQGVLDLEAYVTARMLTDATLPFETIVGEFYAGYGAAREDVRRYFETVRAAGEAARLRHIREVSPTMDLLDDSLLSYWQCLGRSEQELAGEKEMLVEARRKWASRLTPRQQERLDTLILRAEHAVLAYRFLSSISGDRAEAVSRGKELTRFRLANWQRIPMDWACLFSYHFGERRFWRQILPFNPRVYAEQLKKSQIQNGDIE